MQTIPLGSRVRFTETFTNLLTGALSDPSVLTLKLRNPAGVETTYTLAGSDLVRLSLGVFYFEFTLAVAGQWSARWVASGTLIAAHEYLFRVTASAFASP